MAFRRLIVIALLSGTAACVAPSRAPAPAPRPPVAAPLPAPTPSPAPAATYSSWMDVPQTPGDWRYAPAAGSSAARFGEAAGEPRFAILCSGGSQVELVRYGPFAAAAPMTVRSESATRTLTANPAPGGAGLRAVLSARDPLLDAMAFSKGRFAVEAPGAPPLYLPSWPEVTRVIEDCR